MARLLLFACVIALVIVYTYQEKQGRPTRAPRQRCKVPNEVFSRCHTSCEKSCKIPDPFCPAVCVVGCQCRRDFFRRNDGACVRRRECPKDSKDKKKEEPTTEAPLVPVEREGKENKG